MADWDLLLTDVSIATMHRGADDYGTIENGAIAAIRHSNLQQVFSKSWRAGFAIVGSKIQVRQLTLKESRDMVVDRVAIPEHDMTMRGLDAFKLVSQCIMIGLPIGFDPRFDLTFIWFGT